ncbi:MAG: phenylalanine--tRNA ligase subunit alpha [Kiritimatiellae bacterium]|nr:phenylalanine--tRNA ligase subunit alpha [Kiritimatiellia bacterium]
MTLSEIEKARADSLAEIAVADAAAAEALRVKYIGRNGIITALIKAMKDVPKEERPAFGRAVQEWKSAAAAAIAGKSSVAAQGDRGVEADLTLPGRWFGLGVKHPLTRVMEETAEIFGRLGFSVADGPEIENRFNNFTALNTPPHHPSQDRADTFWFGDDLLLRTQTSPVQIRTMMANKPPIRVICPGRTFRRDTTDATHSANFHQIEGLYVDTLPDKPVSLADLKSVLAYFAKSMMGAGATVRFRPHFFPFTEPSVEVDFSCHLCKGAGCAVCKQSGWIEVAGAGMVDPRVFKHVGYDPEKVSGYAFGFGVERIAMIKYGIPDIRWLYENDVRFLSQLG